MIAIIKYNGGNTASVKNALDRLGCESEITDNHETILAADRVIFPGVGEASSTMRYLRSRNMDKLIVGLRQPTLGICLGLQLMCRTSEEGAAETAAETRCLGIFDTKVRLFPPLDIVPHIGWNNPLNMRSALFRGIEPGADFYFVHSYYAEPCSETIAEGDYILPFSVALKKDNFYGVQFHPEKSAEAGAILLQNFLSL
ncbi:MAG: imidazole glycerol phosphate synthase subunit HisH [Prevotellaceae bacterium]|jgi:glutamine amidotransferase|nr:imidazole glycerol phosphate synthase subunit HisH [Prevotellaceae bacterium]